MNLITDPAPAGTAAQPLPDAEVAVMARNGITRVPAFQYHVDGFRYGNLADAMAQVARRGRAERNAR